MFKVTIEQVGAQGHDEVIIRCRELTAEVTQLAAMINGGEKLVPAQKDGETFRLSAKDIFYIESVDGRTFIYCRDGVYECRQKLYELEKIFDGTKLFRCSKSMILNIGKIRSVSPSVNSRLAANLTNGEKVIISRQYVPLLKEKLGM